MHAPSTALGRSLGHAHICVFPVTRPGRGGVRAWPVASTGNNKGKYRVVVTRANNDKDDAKATAETNVGLKAVWYAAEMFGKMVGGPKADSETQETTPTRKMSRAEIASSLRDDYSVNYFVSGKGNMEAYAKNCIFADPFVAFEGVDRFKQNVGNLGGLMQDVQLDLYDFNEDGNDRIVTKWRFSAILSLPWKPLLAAAGSTTHMIDVDAGKVVKHIEDWDVEPGKVVAQLFRPAPKARLQAMTSRSTKVEGDTA